MDDFKEYCKDQIDSLTEDNVSQAKLNEMFKYIMDYAEDNYII